MSTSNTSHEDYVIVPTRFLSLELVDIIFKIRAMERELIFGSVRNAQNLAFACKQNGLTITALKFGMQKASEHGRILDAHFAWEQLLKNKVAYSDGFPLEMAKQICNIWKGPNGGLKENAAQELYSNAKLSQETILRLEVEENKEEQS